MNNPIVNYRQLLDNELAALGENSGKKLLLHSCCGPCSSYVLEYLSHYFDITVLFFNPNIFPQNEYEKRANELTKLLHRAEFCNNVKSVICDYSHEDFTKIVNLRDNEREGGSRCLDCFRLRLEKSAEYAKNNDFDFFTTTLSVSPYKNSRALNEIGGELAEKYGVCYLFSDFKKREGYKRSIELSRQFSLYRQEYCGCEFSLRDSACVNRSE